MGNPMVRNWAKRAALTRIICAFALFMLGFPSGAFALPNLEPYGAEYRLPDGTFASLCLPSEEKGAPHGDRQHCDMCTVSIGHLFMQADAVFAEPPVHAYLKSAWLAPGFNAKRILSYHRQSRGPPLSA
jgi:hypothetical protein